MPSPDRDLPAQSLKGCHFPSDCQGWPQSEGKDSRSRRRNLAKAQAVGKPYGPVVAYGTGPAKFRVTEAMALVVGAYLLISVGIAIKTGVVLFPGVIVIALVVAMSRPRRGLAVTSRGLLVLHQSLVNGAPDRIQAMLPLAALPVVADGQQGTIQTSVDVPVRNDRIRLKRATFEALCQAERDLEATNALSGVAGATPPQAPGWFPDPVGRYHYRFWNGLAWTNHASADGSAYVDPLT